jgi:hypothetical protein
VGRLLVDLIPKIYDAPRVLRIVGKDERPQMVMVHAGHPDAVPAVDDLDEGISGVYDIGLGRYDVTVSVGPSFQSRRQEAVQSMTAFMEAYPPAAPAVADLLAENMDWPGAEAIAKRLRKMVPPQLLDDKDGQAQQEQQTAMMQGNLQKAQQMIQVLSQQLNQSHELLSQKRLELESKERITALQEQTKLLLAEIAARGDLAQAELDAQENRLLAIQTQGHEVATNAAQGQQDGHAAMSDQALQLQQQREAQAHEAAMGQQAHAQALQQGQQAHEQALAQASHAAALAPEPQAPAEGQS